MVAKRGEPLREHILYTAKDVFLEMGFERASMDVISARAETSKRTLYSHFENKEKLYLAVVDFVRFLVLRRLKHPADYGDDASAALVQFCGRFLETLLYAPTIRMCRVSIAEVERFPEGAAQFFDVIFCEAQSRLSDYLREEFGLTAAVSLQTARELLGRITYPCYLRALFGLDELRAHLEDASDPTFDLAPVRRAVAQLIASLNKNEL